MRRIALLAALVGLLLPATASAKSYVFDIPDLVAKPLTAVKQATSLPVLLPSRMTTEQRKLFSSGRGSANRYSFEIGAVRGCGTSTACFVAGFSARRGGAPAAGRKVKLARGHTGSFQPSRCGASCGPATLQWVQGGVLYEVKGKLGTRRSERKILTRLADSAIKNGER